jgi:hypothetical protein
MVYATKNKRDKMNDPIKMIAKYQSTCIRCYFKILIGDPIEYFPETRKVRHQTCKKRKKGYLRAAKVYGGMTS